MFTQRLYNIGSLLYNTFVSKNFKVLESFDETRSLFFFGETYFPNDSISFAQKFDRALELMSEMIVVTYRQNYERLGSSYLTSDAGWGCAIRSSQMLLVNTILHYLDSQDTPEKYDIKQMNDKQVTFIPSQQQMYNKDLHKKHKQIAKELIYDRYNSLCSIHNIYNLQIVKDHNPTGHSFLPPSICFTALSELFTQWDSRPFDCIFCKDYIPNCSKPTLYLIPYILTLSERSLIKLIMSTKQSRGFVGGIGESAIFIFAFQHTTIFFLDPHVVQEAGFDGYDNPTIYQASIDELDNSITFALLCENESDCEEIRSLLNMGSKPLDIKDLKNVDDIDGFEVLEFD